MAMKVSLFFSLMVATLAIPISGVQAFFFWVKVESRPWVMIFSSTALCIAQTAEAQVPIVSTNGPFSQVSLFKLIILLTWFYFLYSGFIFYIMKVPKKFSLHHDYIYTFSSLSLFCLNSIYIYRVLLQPNHGVFFFFLTDAEIHVMCGGQVASSAPTNGNGKKKKKFPWIINVIRSL